MEERDTVAKNPPPAQPPDPTKGEMPFLGHLEELRWRILKGFGGVILGIVVAFIFGDFLVQKVILGPTNADFFIYHLLGMDAIDLTLQSRKLPGQFFTYWGTLIVFGVIIGCPILFYQLWSFIEPAMESTSKWRTRGHTVFITFFFLLGCCFGYFILVPFALQFFSHFQISDTVHNDFDINQYFSSVTMWVFACGMIFQLPVISYFLSKFGLVTPEFLKKYRTYAIILSFIMGALLTPPDPVSQVMVAIPLIFLYQLAIWISALAVYQRKKKMNKNID